MTERQLEKVNAYLESKKLDDQYAEPDDGNQIDTIFDNIGIGNMKQLDLMRLLTRINAPELWGIKYINLLHHFKKGYS